MSRTRPSSDAIRHAASRAAALTAALGLLWLTSAPAAAAQNYIKWDQPPAPAHPQNVYYGWNQESTWWQFGPTVADDWVCDTTDPVVAIRWWGSFLGWRSGSQPPFPPSHFHILFWTDVPPDPGDPTSFSHPGQVIHEIYCYNYRMQFVGWDFDPRTGQYESCFLFEQDLEPWQWFFQTPSGEPTIYWVSISACWDGQPPPLFPWGWKTRPRDPQSPAPDDAVVITEPTMPMLGYWYIAGYPVEFPEGVSWDMAFELTGRSMLPQIKWSQAPDPRWPGLHAHDGPDGLIVLADQWLCQGGDVVDFHWYGNYELGPMGEELRNSGINRFHLSIHANVPGLPWCLPQEPELWGIDVPFAATSETFTGLYNNEGSPIYRYSFVLPFPFDQLEGETYWLDITALSNDPFWPPFWRWQEAGREPAPILCPAAWKQGPIGIGWQSIGWPNGTWSDLAFEVTSFFFGELYIKWSQLPQPYQPLDAFYGRNDPSVYFGSQIVADDWLCTNEDPITDVHWWGSFVGWGYPNPPELPSHFHINIWTNVPGDPSHPGTCLWEYLCYDYRWRFAGWDFDPRDPLAPPEACFYFECDIPQAAWFYQEVGPITTVYWVSISACYDFPPNHPFGWKTRPRDLSSLPPGAAVRIFDPTGPVPGSQYARGEPIWWPTPESPWNTAFQLTARRQEPGLEPKWLQEPYPPGEGFDAESNLWWPGGPGYPKWWQPANPSYPGLHTDPGIELADDWQCHGGPVTDLEWWGNYELDANGREIRGVGIDGFRLVIYLDAGGVPGPVAWTAWVPFTSIAEVYTGVNNIEGSPIYLYQYIPDAQFTQEAGQIYWFEVQMFPNPGDPPPMWRWQEHGRNFPTTLAPAMQNFGAGWTPIAWPNMTFSELAFAVTSDSASQAEVNRVVADDYISDGRDILAVGWIGSYFDPRYEPDGTPGDPLHVLDGWLIGVHWAHPPAPVEDFPPDILAGDPHPTVLAVYFAPVNAVQIHGIFGMDCNGHALYYYYVDLDACCLLCTHPDPRPDTPAYPPGLPGAFQELRAVRYWLDIQAVTGIEWLPPACTPRFTGHIPPLEPGSSGAFWGWHNGIQPPIMILSQAARGQIVDFSPYPPECWDYGDWERQPWECESPPQRVDMAFELWASDCPEDLNLDRTVNLPDLAILLAAYGSCYGQEPYLPAADFDNDGCIGLADLARLLSVYGLNCPTGP